MSLTLTYDNTLSRVRTALTGLVDAATYRLERSTDQIRWTTVRGGSALAPSGGAASLDSYEFAADVENFYRLRGPTVADDFGRTVGAGGLGTATSGQTYILSSTATDYSVSSGAARIATTTINTLYYATIDTQSDNHTVRCEQVCPVIPTGAPMTLRVVGRWTDGANSYYEAQLLIDTSGAATLSINRRVSGTGAVVDGGTVVGTHAAGNRWVIILDVAGSALRAKAWNDSTGSDPGDWQVVATDTSLTTGTMAGFGVRRESGNTNGTTTVTFDDFIASPETTVASDSITPTLDAVWLKSITRPFLNRPVKVGEYSPFTRPSRAGVFDIVGRELPIAVTDVMGSKRLSVDIYARDAAEARALDLLLASGDILFIHTPATGPLSTVPSGYAVVGQPEEEVLPTYALNVRRFTVPYTLVAAPGPDVVGVTSTWQTVVNSYATWADLVAAFATWADVLDTVGSAEDVITE